MEISTISIRKRIYTVRGTQVVLDTDLANLYQTKTKVLNQAVRRNPDRFPMDFMFKLTTNEYEHLKTKPEYAESLKHGGPRYVPTAFTEHGVAMLSTVLRSSRAVEVNITIMRSFRQVRQTSLDEAKGQINFENNLLAKVESRFSDFEQRFELRMEKLITGMSNIVSQPKVLPALPQTVLVQSNPLDDGTCEAIHQAVAQYFSLKLSRLKATTRSRSVVIPQQIAIYICRNLTGKSFADIAKSSGLKDHTTARHAYQKISEMIEKEPAIKKSVSAILKSLGH